MVESDLRRIGLIEGRLTEAQEGLWLARRLDPDNPSQNTGHILRLNGEVPPAVACEALDAALSECDAFGVQIVDGPDGPWITSEGVAPPRTTVVDVSAEGRPARVARARIQADVERPRDPASDPMVTSVLYRVGPNELWWYLCAQHLVIDGYGTTLLNVRVLDLLGAALSASSTRTKPFASFAGVLDEDSEYRDSSERPTDRDFWLSELDGVDDVRSLKDGEPLAQAFHHRARALIDPEVHARLSAIAKEAEGAWPDAVLAATAAYVGRHLRTPDVVVGVPVMNRLGSASARVPASVMNVVPVRVSLDEAVTPTAMTRSVRDTMRRLRPHVRYRSEELRREVGAVGSGRRLFGPLVNVLPFQPLPRLRDIDVSLEVLGAGPVDDLTITFRGGGVGRDVALEIDANPSLYSLRETEAHRDRLMAFLEGFGRAGGPLRDVPTLTDAEANRWLDEVNATEHEVEETTLVDLIERRAARYAERPALVSEDGVVTYSEFIARVRRGAAELASAGAGTADLVAVLLGRSEDQVVAFFAAMWCGAAYLPLDPEHPPARIDQLIASAAPVVLVTDRADFGSVEGTAVVDIRGWADLEGRATEELSRPSATDAAYTIFTSGSTGDPKGVVVEHRAIVNRLEWMREAYGVGPDDVVLYKTPATFDVSVWELFLPALSGAALVIAPPDAQRDPAWLGRLIREHGVTTMHFVPSMLGPFLDHPDNGGLEVMRVFCSGEALSADLRDRFHERVRGELHNLYGPTEAAVDVSHWAAPASDRSDPIPIGRPVWNTRLYVLDDHRRPVPDGVVGELYIGGRQLARGYLGRDDLTEDRFVPDPHRPGERMYRTGDLARWRSDGALLFEGRVDHQVKVRGQRIELGEVESALRAVEGVRDAVVVLRGSGDAAQLVAYLVGESAQLGEVDARAHLARLLPEAMVPGAFVRLDVLPTTTSGKVDRRALPDPPRARPQDAAALATRTEREVADVFRSVLGLDAVPGPTDDFFALGGQSLSAITVLAELRSRLGIDVGPGTLFARPTVARLANALDDAANAQGGANAAEASAHDLRPLLVLRESSDDSRPPVYCVHPAGGISWCYGALARTFDPPRRVVTLQARGLRLDHELPETLDAMAEDYVDQIMAVHEGGPVHLIGWSTGGTIAHVMATHLLDRGEELGLLALLDAYPSDRFRQKSEPRPGAAYEALLLIAGVDPKDVPPEQLTREGVRSILASSDHLLGTLSEDALDGIVRVVGSSNRLVSGHDHRRLEADVVHFRAGLDHVGKDLDAEMWRPYSREVEAHVTPALHSEMTSARVSARIATVIHQNLSRLESR